ncbi:hypothetical protein [Plebeiibacterium marinum]|uniref:Uncharacterized protein n=1 Tax=Plebeiibacterium marinum TaxID=2992111 RepID=A0AAE3SJ00_9BACT|nr:hypothetical protein [Plebeiobacterium marinum]MCW3804908.1 hypothetical protein [Plebeiobacterium marinum]
MWRIVLSLLMAFVFVNELNCYAVTPDNITLKFEFSEGVKDGYVVGDVLKCTLIVIQKGKYCAEGVHKVKLYVKGLNILEKGLWKQTSASEWHRQVCLGLKAKKSGSVQLTAYRKTDKGEVVETAVFKSK